MPSECSGSSQISSWLLELTLAETPCHCLFTSTGLTNRIVEVQVQFSSYCVQIRIGHRLFLRAFLLVVVDGDGRELHVVRPSLLLLLHRLRHPRSWRSDGLDVMGRAWPLHRLPRLDHQRVA